MALGNIKLLRWANSSDSTIFKDSLPFQYLQFSFFLPHTRVAMRMRMKRIRASPVLGEVILWSASVRGHISHHWPHCVSWHGLSLTLDSELGPGLGTSAASGVRGQARPGLPCNRAPARGPSPQLIKVKRKNTNIVKKYKKGTQPRPRGGEYESKRYFYTSRYLLSAESCTWTVTESFNRENFAVSSAKTFCNFWYHLVSQLGLLKLFIFCAIYRKYFNTATSLDMILNFCSLQTF